MGTDWFSLEFDAREMVRAGYTDSEIRVALESEYGLGPAGTRDYTAAVTIARRAVAGEA